MSRPLSEVEVTVVRSLDDALACKRWLGERHGTDALALDTETGGLSPHRDALRLVQFGDTEQSFVIRWDMWAGLVHEVLADWQGHWIGHNMAFDMRFLERNGCTVPRHRLHDTKVLAHLDNPVRSNSLKPLSVALLDKTAAKGQELLQQGMKKQGWTWATVPFDFAPYMFYAGFDTTLTARLWEHLAPAREAYPAAYDLEMATALICSDMAMRGMRVDRDYLGLKLDDLEAYCEQVTAWIKEHYGVSPGSNAAVTNRLLADGVRLEKRTASGNWSVDSEVLEALEHPLAVAVLRHRQCRKVASTYFQGVADSLDGDILRADINPLAARTGRMSISRPPLQQLPSGSALVRDMFIPREGNRLAMIDYDNVEMRLLAHFANESGMVESIRRGGDEADLHAYTARMLGVPRKVAKTINFAKAYGAGPAKMAAQLGITEEAARAFVERYDATFPGIPTFIREVERVGHERERDTGTAYITNPYGRRVPKAKEDGVYVLTNYLIQSTAADVLKSKLVALDAAGLAQHALISVHDEVIFEFPAESAEDLTRAAVNVMAETERFSVPLTVAAEIHDSWGAKYAA